LLTSLPFPAKHKVFEQMAQYSETKDVNKYIKHYLKKVVEQQPDNVIEFLINEIKTNPCDPSKDSEEKSN
tara:strand:- start:353 stop:562 length:210 start_codon:yes stop_codon:yes gene_type:complete